MIVKVLVVEDNIALRQNILDVLEFEGYEAIGVQSILEAASFLEEDYPHIVLLDIMLPGGPGYDLIPIIRCKYEDTRIIMLTALGDYDSKKVCYDGGADDYITKPFDLTELVYKLNAMKRRIIASKKVLQLGDLTYYTDSGKLKCGEKSVILPPSQMRLFKLLVDKYMLKSYLDKKDVFGTEVDESHRIQTFIGRIRDNLNFLGSKQVYIETLYGKGYQLDIQKCRDYNE